MFRPVMMLLALLVLSLARPAYADECNSPVFDTTGKINATEVEPLLKKIVGDGADPALVRVITTAEMNQHGNLDKYAGNMLTRCPSWQSAGGRLKANIFLLILEPNGKVAVQFSKKGPFQSILTHNKIVDIGEEMGGLIRKGDLTGAAKAGLMRSHALISTTKAESRIVASGPVTIVNHNEKPADLSGGFSFLKWLLLAGALAGVVWLLFYIKSRKEERQAAQQKAQSTRADCNDMLLGFDTRLNKIGSFLSSYKSMLSTNYFETFQDQLKDLDRRVSVTKGQFVSSQSTSNDPECVGLSADQYDAMTDIFERHLGNLGSLDRELSSFESAVMGIKRLRDGAQPAIDTLTSEIESATSKVNAERSMKTNGPRSLLQQAINCAEVAQKSLEEKNYQIVADACKEGTALARKAAQQVQDLISRKQRIESDITRLDQDSMAEKLTSLDALISEIKTTFGEESVTPALEQRIVVIQRTQTRLSSIALAKSSVLTQNWDSAEQQITIARSAESDISNAINTVRNLSRRLSNARHPQHNSSSRPSSGYGSSRSNHHGTNTTVVNNYGGGSRYDNDGLVLGLGLGLALDNIETNEENRRLRRDLEEERRGYGGRGSSRDDDDDRRGGFGGFGGESVQSSSNDDNGWGGESIDTSSSSSDSDFSSNDSSSNDD
jgi:protein-S-isoprenylcysteine O-methyltransferase Ste14